MESLLVIFLIYVNSIVFACHPQAGGPIASGSLTGYRILYTLHPLAKFTYNTPPFSLTAPSGVVIQSASADEAGRAAMEAMNQTIKDVLTRHEFRLRTAPNITFHRLFDEGPVAVNVLTACTAPVTVETWVVNPESHFLTQPCGEVPSPRWPPYVEIEFHLSSPQAEQNMNVVLNEIKMEFEAMYGELVPPESIVPIP